MKAILPYLEKIPEGYSEGSYKGITYRITKQIFNRGRSGKVFAEASGDSDFISLNYYITSEGFLLKPCEMPSEKVIHFLQKVRLHKGA